MFPPDLWGWDLKNSFFNGSDNKTRKLTGNRLRAVPAGGICLKNHFHGADDDKWGPGISSAKV
jgi:hypothetical protein